MRASVTISVEILKKIDINHFKEKIMVKKAKDRDNVKAVPELGVGKDGYKTGGVTVQATDPFEISNSSC